MLFGDGAGAMVFRARGWRERNGGRGILTSALYGDGNHRDILYVPGGGSARRPFVCLEMSEAAVTVPVMDGKAVFELAVTRFRRSPRGAPALRLHHGRIWTS